ncbi:MAG: hypothetical protein PHG69_05695, partial [Candidatus Omnitrophica bacterium]|nr:hypothetical protein [Candidatus Omnitrophota bacterium]
DRLQVSIPRKFFIRCYLKQGFLSRQETLKTYRKFRELEIIFNKLSHIISIVEKIRQKGWKEIKFKDDDLTQVY